MSYCSSSRRTRFTVLYFKRWAYSRNICTAHAQKRLHVNFRFAITVQNFVDLATFSVDFCILFAECPLYFYLRFVWPSDLESTPHASTPTSIIPASVFVCWYVTWPSDLVFWPFKFEQLMYMAGHVINIGTKFEDPTVLDLWLITFPVRYNWKCVRGHCACAESRGLWVGLQKQWAVAAYAFSKGNVITHNSRTDSLRVFKLRGKVGHAMCVNCSKSRGQSQGHKVTWRISTKMR